VSFDSISSLYQYITTQERDLSVCLTQGLEFSIIQSIIIIFRRQHVHPHLVCECTAIMGGRPRASRNSRKSTKRATPYVQKQPRRAWLSLHQQRVIGSGNRARATTSHNLLGQRRCRTSSHEELPEEEGQRKGGYQKSTKKTHHQNQPESITKMF